MNVLHLILWSHFAGPCRVQLSGIKVTLKMNQLHTDNINPSMKRLKENSMVRWRNLTLSFLGRWILFGWLFFFKYLTLCLGFLWFENQMILEILIKQWKTLFGQARNIKLNWRFYISQKNKVENDVLSLWVIVQTAVAWNRGNDL